MQAFAADYTLTYLITQQGGPCCIAFGADPTEKIVSSSSFIVVYLLLRSFDFVAVEMCLQSHSLASAVSSGFEQTCYNIYTETQHRTHYALEDGGSIYLQNITHIHTV
jgi:hypothetical protein